MIIYTFFLCLNRRNGKLYKTRLVILEHELVQ